MLYRNIWKWHHFKLSGVTALFSHTVGMKIPCFPFIHTWEELEHSYAVVCQSFFFSTFNRKVILSASLKMFIETCGFYMWNSFFERTCESNYQIGNRYFTPLQTQLEVLDTTADLQNSQTALKTPKMVYPKKCWKLLEVAF